MIASKKSVLFALTLTALIARAVAATYQELPDWLKLPAGRAQIGNQHGDVAVSATGEVYVSTMDPDAGIMVFAANGKYLRNVPGAPNDFHGFVIRKDNGTEYIFGPRLTEQTIVKLTLDGKKVLEIPASAIPDKFKVAAPATKKNAQGESIRNPDAGKFMVRMTGMDVAPNGDLFVTDGYSSDYVHRFDRNGKYLKSFGGKKEPYNFKTLHKIAIDTRFTPARILACDRANLRMVHLSLDGDLLGVVATDLLLPSAVAIQGEYALIGELKGQVTILDKAGKIVTKIGTNTNPELTTSNKAEPSKWVNGIVTAPHGVVFMANGDVLVSEYNVYGRVHRFNRQ
jgi:hypothetical protein